jgi:hypothetical protein
MNPIGLMRKFKLRSSFWLAMVMAAVLVCGCQSKPAPLSPGAASFKHEIKTCISNLSVTLMEPLAKKDVPAITAALGKVESPAVKLCSLCPFKIGVLDRNGGGLAQYPSRSGNNMKNYSSYDLIAKAIKSKKVQQQRFYLQDGSELYIICAPILREDNLVGLVAIAINSEDAKKRWDLTEKDFLALNFNN